MLQPQCFYKLFRSQYSLWIQWPILMCLSLLTGLAGLYMYAFYAGCDPVTAKRIGKADQLLILMVVDTMSQYPGDISATSSIEA